MHRPSPFLQPLQKNTYHLPCSPLPLHRILSPSQPLQKDNNPSPRTKLASLVKGEVLSPEKIRATTGGIASPPSLALHQPFQNCTIPRPAPPHLPPLSKGGGLTAKHKLLLCCVLLAICPLFLYCKLFCRQDGGIASVASTLSIPTTFSKALPPFATHHPFQNLITPQFLIIPHPTFISFLHTLDNFRR